MRDYQIFSLMDFVQDADFIRWVREKRPADQHFWEEWLTQNPEKRGLLSEARRVLESIEITQKIIPREEIQLQTEKLLRTIGAFPSSIASPPSTPFGATSSTEQTLSSQTPAAGNNANQEKQSIAGGRRKWWLAAAILAPIAAGLFYFSQPGKTQPQKFAYSAMISSRHFIERVNTSIKPDTFLLSDGSLVRLAPNSRISYPHGFDTASVREVFLSGEAFFQVVKNPRHPFRVTAGEVVTKVLGTSFCVRSFEKDTTIQVVVQTGKVSVYSHAVPAENSGGIIVTCNQKLVYKKTAQKFQKTLLESPALITPEIRDETMAYEDTPLEEVFTRLSKAYGINIVYDNELVKKSTVTADLKGETFYHKLDLICRAVGAEYEVIDGQVVISFSNAKPIMNE